MLRRLFRRTGREGEPPRPDETSTPAEPFHDEAPTAPDLARDLARATSIELTRAGWNGYSQPRFGDSPTATALLVSPDDELTAVAAHLVRAARDTSARDTETTALALVSSIVRRRRAWSDDALADLIAAATDHASRQNGAWFVWWGIPDKGILKAVTQHLDGTEPRGRLRDELQRMRSANGDDARSSEMRRLVDAILDPVTDGDAVLLPSDDPWARALVEEAADDAIATRILMLAATARGARRPARFTTAAARLADDVDGEAFAMSLSGLIRAAADTRGTDDEPVIPPPTGDVLRGLCWIAAVTDTDEAGAALADLALTCWKKVFGYGARSQKAGGTALLALAEIPAAAPQLSRVRPHMRGARALRAIDEAIGTAAERLGISRDEFEERVVPHYDLGADGTRETRVGEHTAVVSLDERGAPSLRFRTDAGRLLKSVPAAVRADHPDELAALRAEVKDMAAMASAQRIRLERLLLDDPTWRLADWRERYVDHPLVAPLARRLIWIVDGTPVLWTGEAFADVAGTTVDLEDHPDREVGTWHPGERPTDEVHAWRTRLEELGITQPFKQAHREIYLLTPAEQETGTYSNRFAAHVLRQHQMAALARARGWTYALQGAWDAPDECATLTLTRYGLTASFFVERPWDAEDWNDAGVFNHVLSDQVRFDDGHETVRLDRVPVRVLSEVLRDVDLFVGVTSIGNDPTWADQGDGRYRTYWSGYAFGELGASGDMRREVLERLLPRLAIRDVAHIDGRFLVVRGTIRTYRIHLGSTNILMSPNDQYLCIVPARGADGDPTDVYLPFEGDRGLALILSKAMMLARDDRITDTTILAQINRP